MRKKIIIIATGIFPPDIGGPATYTKTIARALTRQDFRVKVLTYGSRKKSDKENNNFEVVYVSRAWPRGLRHFIYFLKLFSASKNAKLIFSQNAVGVGIPVFLVSRLRKVKYVIKVVGDKAWEIAQNKRKTVLSIGDFQKNKKVFSIKLISNFQAFTCKKSELVIVPSIFLSKIVACWGVGEEKIKVIYNGTDGKLLNIKKEEARKKIGIPGNIIISIGRLVPWKGFKMLIKIMPELLKINPFFRLIIIGSGPEEKNLKRIINNLGLRNKVYLIGRKSKESLNLYFAASDMFVLNTFYEGFSHQIIEALAAGVPVITTSIGGNPEIIKQGENGFMVKFNDERNLIEAIKTIDKRQDIREKFIENGFKTAKIFSVQKMISETIKVLL